MKRIINFLFAMAFAIPLYSQEPGWVVSMELPGNVYCNQHDWDTLKYDQYYVTYFEHHYYDTYGLYYRYIYLDESYTNYGNTWENDDYVFLKTCEYELGRGLFADVLPLISSITSSVCLANTLTGIKSPDIPDNLVIPSMPEINLFLVDLAFVTNRTTHINSVTLPDMIRGVYNSSGKTLYVDTLYVEGDYERMVNNVERIRTLCSYDMQYIPVVYYNKPFVPALIPKVVMYNGQPLRHYVGGSNGCGMANDTQFTHTIPTVQWGDKLETFEYTDTSNPFAQIMRSAFENNKTLKQVKIACPITFHYYDLPYGTDRYNIGAKAFYGCENLVKCEFAGNVEFGDSLFMNCAKLDSFILKPPYSNSLITIPERMFCGCRNLRYIGGFDNYIYEVGAAAFRDCENLTSNGETWRFDNFIGDYAFLNCRNFSAHVKIDSRADVGKCAFMGSGIISVEFYENHADNFNISYDAFDECHKLERVIINQESGELEIPDFYDCPNLKTVTIRGEDVDEECGFSLVNNNTLDVIDNLDTLYLLNGIPQIYEGSYRKYNFPNTVLCVNEGMTAVYKENPNAPTFKAIVEFTDEQVGIIKVTTDGAAGESDADAPVYDLSGQRVLKTIPGNVYVSKGRKFIAQ